MRWVWIFCLLLIFTSSCGNKKASLSGSDVVDADEFFEAFPEVKLPFNAADSNLQRIADTTSISLPVLSQFVPDSVLTKYTSDSKKVNFFPVGKIKKKNELYLLLNIAGDKKLSLVTYVFDGDKKYLSGLPLISNKNQDDYIHSVAVNTEPTFLISREKTTKDNKYLYTKNGLAYSKDLGDFIAIINDSNEDLKKRSEIINPIDTFKQKNKYSGDYTKSKNNFISLRDGRNTDTYVFFIHFEKNNGDCVGELKGDLKMVSENKAVYQSNGDPCVIDFAFAKNYINVKEQGNCGNHRGIRCYFDDRYTKKKPPTNSQPKKKAK